MPAASPLFDQKGGPYAICCRRAPDPWARAARGLWDSRRSGLAAREHDRPARAGGRRTRARLAGIRMVRPESPRSAAGAARRAPGGSRMKALLLALVLASLTACEDDQSDRSVVGPGIEVHCASQRLRADANRNPGIGDTSTRVTCPGTL